MSSANLCDLYFLSYDHLNTMPPPTIDKPGFRGAVGLATSSGEIADCNPLNTITLNSTWRPPWIATMGKQASTPNAINRIYLHIIEPHHRRFGETFLSVSVAVVKNLNRCYISHQSITGLAQQPLRSFLIGVVGSAQSPRKSIYGEVIAAGNCSLLAMPIYGLPPTHTKGAGSLDHLLIFLSQEISKIPIFPHLP